MFNSRFISLFIAGCLWLLVAFRISGRAFDWLTPYFLEPDWRLALLLVSFIIGIAKANTVLKKAVLRNLANVDKLKGSLTDYLFGFLKLFGARGVIMILFMIALGFGLRYIRMIGFDPYNLFGFLYLGIGFALAVSSKFYFKAALNILKSK